MIAINICDLDFLRGENRGGFNPVALLLRDFVDSNTPQHIMPSTERWDEAAMLLDGPAAQDEERLNALIELLQTSLGPRKIGRRVRCYKQGPRGGWNEIRPGKTNRQLMEDLKDE